MDTSNPSQASPLRVLIAAEHASARYGGEAFLPLHYFQRLRARNVEAWLVCHSRVKHELLELMPEQAERMLFVEETAVHVHGWAISRRLPARVGTMTCDPMLHLYTQLQQRALVRTLVAAHGIHVVHEPVPVSPKQPSLLFDVGAPVVIGPMNGGMTYPPGFRKRQAVSERFTQSAGRAIADLANLVIPGKRAARILLVANARTRAALPRVLRNAPVEELAENGVDLQSFKPRSSRARHATLRLAYVGRLVDWKAVDLLLDALKAARNLCRIELDVFGGGPLLKKLEQQAAELGLTEAVTFHGFVPQEQVAEQLRQLDALVLPSLFECGGAVVLEAMAIGLPVIATRWGGPTDYLDESCGILVDPHSPEQMTRDLAAAMCRLAADPDLAERLGHNALEKVQEYDWDRKIDRILTIYERARQKSPAKQQINTPPMAAPNALDPTAGARVANAYTTLTARATSLRR